MHVLVVIIVVTRIRGVYFDAFLRSASLALPSALYSYLVHHWHAASTHLPFSAFPVGMALLVFCVSISQEACKSHFAGTGVG